MNNYNKGHERDAVKFYRSDRAAILSTISKTHKGYPFGSFVTYTTGWDRTIFLYLSDLADHTKNLKNDRKSCITILKKNTEGDIQNSARLTLIGDLEIVSDNINKRCKDRFHKIFPESKAYAQMHDFNFYQITVNQARWIGGFGKISWLDTKNWSRLPIEWYNNEQSMIDHMNEDHANTIKSALHAQHGVEDHDAIMIALSIDGYYIRSKNDLFFINFDCPVFSSTDYRNMLIDLSKKYRSYEI
tara:strand:+ start:4361 stop:5092 length:732 start_codon:yes stop_codon:yes gene_type:complete